MQKNTCEKLIKCLPYPQMLYISVFEDIYVCGMTVYEKEKSFVYAKSIRR